MCYNKYINTLLLTLMLTSITMFSNDVKAQYCTPSYFSSCSWYNTYINSFSTSGGSTNITNTNTGCNNSSSYVYFSSLTHTGAQGTTVSFTIGNNPSYGLIYAIYVDFNGDQDFTDPGEQVYSSSIGAGSSASSSFTIPVSATIGTTRMRVISDYFGPLSPCGTRYYGECEDYNFAITAGCPATISAHPADVALCSGSNTSFSVTASGTTGVQWQVSTNSGSTWSNVSNGGVYSGATTTTLSITGATVSLDNNLYRCVASNSTSSCSVNSNSAMITVYGITSTTPGFGCTSGASSVSAVANTGLVKWYDQSSGGTLLGSGNILNIGSSPASNTTYYAQPGYYTYGNPDTLNTFVSNNGQASAMLDIKPLNNIRLTGINFTPRTASTYTVSVYYKVGTMVGSELVSGDWTLYWVLPVEYPCQRQTS